MTAAADHRPTGRRERLDRVRRTLGAGLAVLTLGLPLARPAAAQCCPPTLLAEFERAPAPGENLGGPLWVGADDFGTVHVILRDGLEPLLWTSVDAGESFLPEVRGLTEGAIWLAMGVAPGGVAVVVYQKDDLLWSRTTTDRAATWSAPVSLFPMAPDSWPWVQYLDVVVLDDGLTVVMANVQRGAPELISVAASVDHGRTWQPAITQAVIRGGSPKIAATSSTIVFAFPTESDEIHVRRSVDRGATWLPAVRADATGDIVRGSPDLSTTGDGAWQLSYHALLAEQLHVVVSTDDGATWPAANHSVIAPAMEVEPGRLVPTPDGRVVVGGWLDPAGAAGGWSNVSNDRGLPGTWQAAPFPFATAGAEWHHFRFAPLADGSVAVFHDDYRHDSPSCPSQPDQRCESVMGSRLCPGAAAWQEEVRLDLDLASGPTHSEDPEVAASATGRVHVAWEERQLGPTHLRIKTFEHAVDRVLPTSVLAAPSPDCLFTTHLLELETQPTLGCTNPVVQWHLNGAPIPGANGASHAPDPTDVDGVNAWHVTLDCGPGCVFRSADLVPVPSSGRPELSVTPLPPTACQPPATRLEAVPLPPDECIDPAYQWFVDDAPIPGATDPTLLVSALSLAVGDHDVRYVVDCTPPRTCDTSETVTVTVEPDTVPTPADVGPVLFATGHGDPLAALITADFEWSGDRGSPRVDEHYHVQRGADPRSLALLAGLEPHAGVTYTDSTPAAAALPLVHFFRVLAANDCERISSD